ncbi:MAG: hypothetical protein U9P14_07400 [Gemmatimonadota bacterium]|nr:hypothetical protein [Gemmatimonadota bacterium]
MDLFWKRKKKAERKQKKHPDKLKQLQQALAGEDKNQSTDPVLKAFTKLMRQDKEDDSWADKQSRQPDRNQKRR